MGPDPEPGLRRIGYVSCDPATLGPVTSQSSAGMGGASMTCGPLTRSR